MPKIAILPDVLASQVAAGEVVERPASVVKEMVENALDAGAKQVEVEILQGGVGLIKITDDGCGMAREDALLSLERHATSKLRDVRQLMSISTMGFRGEAVPSIASVSKFRLSTREHDAVEGTEIAVEGGVVKDVRVTGMQPGTVCEVRQLFFNVPARKKFLSAETTESAHVEYQVKLHALAWPQVRFTYRKDGRVVFDLPGTHDKRMRIAGLAGAEVGRSVIEVPLLEYAGMEVYGYILPSEFARKGRRQQYVFLNGRPIEDAAISRALKDGFKGNVAEGLNPTAWLWLEMNPAMVDVNVHPAKREVRFHKPFDVRQLVMTAVEKALAEHGERKEASRGVATIISRKDGSVQPVVRRPFETRSEEPEGDHPEEISSESPASEVVSGSPMPVNSSENGASAGSRSFAVKREAVQEDLAMPEGQGAPEALRVTPRFQILGVLHERYLLMQGDEGLVMMDPKAARERIVFERFMAGDASHGIEAQGLLVPELIDLDARDLDVVLTNLENFTEAGIGVEHFGGNTLQVRSMPAILSHKDPRSFVLSLIDELVETMGGKRGKHLAYEVFAGKLAKKTAWNEPCKRAGAEVMLDALFRCALPYCTPDGKPTLIQLSLKELERKFGK